MNTNASLGATVRFRVMANTAYPPLRYQWQHVGTNLPAATNEFLVVTNLTVADAGRYMAWVSNAINGFTNSRTAILTVDTTFTKITQGPVVTDREPSGEGAWGDYDDDGRLDLFVPNSLASSARNALYRNLGGDNFVRITNDLTELSAYRRWGAAWGDVDNDGDLDIIILRPFESGLGMSRNEMFKQVQKEKSK